MIELLEKTDPAGAAEIDKLSLRAKVDERIGLTPPLLPEVARRRRRLMAAVTSFAAVSAVVVAVVFLNLNKGPQPLEFGLAFTDLGDLPGIEQVVRLETGGVKSTAVDGDSIWVMEALHEKLNRISASSGVIEATYEIDAYVEGVEVGGGYLWLSSYDNGGEALRFDPATGLVDRRIPIGGAPGWSAWFGDSLWISNDQGDLHQIAPGGEIVSTTAGELKGQGLGYLWVNDPDTGLISSLAADGTRGEMVIATGTGLNTADGWGVRSVAEAGGVLWLMDGDYPYGTNLSVFDPESGELTSFGGITFGLHSMIEFEGSLWLTSHTDHVLIRIDPEGGEVQRYPLPGKAGGMVVADGSLWVALHHPGALVRVDPEAGLIETAEIAADDWNRFPHRLLCTGTGDAGGPTVILEAYDWIDYGLWSVIQAQLSNQGYVVCANGYLEGEATPQQRAADLEQALIEAEIPGPYVLVAAGDGVHASRLFADGRSDIAGVVLVDPLPLGFQAFLGGEIGEAGHPPWADLDPNVSAGLDDFGDLPLVVIGQDPKAGFLTPRFIEAFGIESAQAINSYWLEGLNFYAGLATNTRTLVASGSGMEMMVWDRPDLVVEEVVAVLDEVGVTP